MLPLDEDVYLQLISHIHISATYVEVSVGSISYQDR